MKKMREDLNLKIYWVTTVWPKGQIIIPRDVREEFNIMVWIEYVIVMMEKTAFWIWLSLTCNNSIDNDMKLIEKFWSINIWTKFQFVIPCDIRKELGINPWDNLIVTWKWKEWIWFIKNDKIEYLLDFIKENTK